MRKAIFQSIPEILTYAVLLLMLTLNIIGLSISINNVKQSKANTQQIEMKVDCIAAYFNTAGRTGNTTLNSLSNCSIKG